MQYYQIAVKTTTKASELVSEILSEITQEGVSILDSNDFNSCSWDYIDETLLSQKSDVVVVNGFVEVQKKEETLAMLAIELDSLKKTFDDCGSLETSLSIFDDCDWVKVRNSLFKPFEIENVVVCPVWESVDTQKTVVVLDPGLAFGTGEHETTSMCISFLQKIDVKDSVVADLGCGSGILGLTALKLGGRKCFFVDNDKQAVDATCANAQSNNILEQSEILFGSVSDFDIKKVDIVLANLTADILKNFFNEIAGTAKVNGFLILSGILKTRLEEIVSISHKFGCEVASEQTRGEWSALLLRKTHE